MSVYQHFSFVLDAINHGVRLALSAGSITFEMSYYISSFRIGCVEGAEVINVQVKLHDIQLTGSISPALYSAAASDCIRACLRHAECILLQPMMRVEVCHHFSAIFLCFSIDHF